MEGLKFDEFDLLGIFELSEVSGIEKYVTPIKDGKYLSRSSLYYQERTCYEENKQRNELREILTNGPSKRNFVILENMLNCSGKVYYNKLKEYMQTGNSSNYNLAKKCLEEDCNNIINVLEGKKILPTEYGLPNTEDKTINRLIEMDNKMMLYKFANGFKNLENEWVVTPGLGAIYIGPFMKRISGSNYSNLVYSAYKEDAQKKDDMEISKLISDQEVLSSSRIFLIDDNIGTGHTIKTLKEEFGKMNIKVLYGAVQFNWINYSKVSNGEKGIEKFDVKDVDLLTPINYPGHKLMEHAIEKLEIGGEAYIQYLNSKDYRGGKISDFEELINRGEINAEGHGIDLYGEYNNILKETAIELSRYMKGLTPKLEDKTLQTELEEGHSVFDNECDESNENNDIKANDDIKANNDINYDE